MKFTGDKLKILTRTIFGAMGPMKNPIYLGEVLGSEFINMFRNYISVNQEVSILKSHELYLVLEWLIEVKENIHHLDYELTTGYDINDLELLISEIKENLLKNGIKFKRINK